ncbi:MAG: dihydroneopterin triphosphate diphosphatase [Gammaproteobacteria bacterium]
MLHKRPESVLVVVYTIRCEVLMLRRKWPPDFWQSVTGSLEWDETPAQAARRELAEESGLAADGLIDCNDSHMFAIYPMWRHRYAPGVTQNREHVFRLTLPGRRDIVLDESEHQQFAWLPKAEAAARATSHTNRDAILTWVPDPD